jgi:hypothetical protein
MHEYIGHANCCKAAIDDKLGDVHDYFFVFEEGKICWL